MAPHQKHHEALPVIRMLSSTQEEIARRALRVINEIKSEGRESQLEATLLSGESAIGGGAGPTSALPTSLIALSHSQLSADELERRLRSSVPPIVGRIAQDKVLIDLRTVFEDEEPILIAALKSLSN